MKTGSCVDCGANGGIVRERCRSCYGKALRRGALDNRGVKYRGGDADRFLSKVDKGDGCWIWRGSLNSGWRGAYGRLRFKGRTALAHRVSWELHFGPIPEKAEVCHSCDNPSCVRPDHLFLGTHADNMGDMMKKGRGRSKLTRRSAEAIRAMYAAGAVRQRDVAAAFGVTQTLVSQIVRGKIWNQGIVA